MPTLPLARVLAAVLAAAGCPGQDAAPIAPAAEPVRGRLAAGGTAAYRLSPATTGVHTVEVRSLDFDARLTVHEGSTPAASPLAELTDGGIEEDVRWEARLDAGSDYLLVVAAEGQGAGQFELHVRAGAVPLPAGPAAERLRIRSFLARAERRRIAAEAAAERDRAGMWAERGLLLLRAAVAARTLRDIEATAAAAGALHAHVEAHGPPAFAVYARVLSAFACNARGEFAASLDHLDAAARDFALLGARRGWDLQLHALRAEAAVEVGRLADGLESARAFAAIVDRLGDEASRAQSRRLHASLTARAAAGADERFRDGRVLEARAGYEAALELAAGENLAGERRRLIRRLATVEQELGELLRARELLAEQLDDPDTPAPDRADARFVLGTVLRDMGDLDAARAALLTAAGELAAAGDRDAETNARLELGVTLVRAGDPAAARDALEHCLRLAVEHGHDGARGMAQSYLAGLARRAGDLDGARARADEASRLLDADFERLRPTYQRARLDLQAGELASVRVALAAARATLEAGRVRGLGVRSASVVRSHWAEWAELPADLLRAELARCRSSEERRERIEEAWARLGDFKGRSVLDGARGGAEPPAPLAAIQRVLRSGDLVLDFVTGEDDLFALVVTEDACDLQPLGPREEVRRELDAYLGAISDPRLGTSMAALVRSGAALFRLLLAPCLSVDVERIWVVPHAELRGLPLEALIVSTRAPAAEVRGFDEVRFAIEDLELRYLPAARLLIELAERPARARPGGVLLLADPDVAASSLPPLPGSREEAERIAALHPDATVHLGAAASIDRVRGDLSGFAMLHFAAHGILDPVDERRSRIALAGGDLTIREVLALALDADLVVLSGCATARGRARPGDGVQSMANAFLRAGARAVIASQWPVQDAATATTMIRCHELIGRDGLDPAVALRRARLELLRGAAPDDAGVAEPTRGKPVPRKGERAAPHRGHPFFWAPFVHIGGGRGR